MEAKRLATQKLYIYTCIHTRMFGTLSLYMILYVYVYVYVYVHVYVYVYIYMCVYLYVYKYKHMCMSCIAHVAISIPKTCLSHYVSTCW